MTKQENGFVEFTHESKFDVSKFEEYPFNQDYNGPIFSTCHNGIGYNWRIFIQPNGGRYRMKLDNGKWSELQEDRENIVYGLEFLGGPLSSVSVDYSMNVRPRDQNSAVIHKLVRSDCLFASVNSKWVRKITSKHNLEKDGSFVDGFLKVFVEVKMNFDLFDPAKVLQKLKEQISLEQENITAVPSFFFASIEIEPAYGICLKLVCGAENTIFYCVPQILEENSEYFQNILNCSGEFKEKKEFQIKFLDKDPEGVRAALEYLYTKKLSDNFKEIAAACLPVAHLFLLPGLVLECERVLIGNLSAENDVDMALTAQTYDLTLLKNMAMNSMAMHFEDVLDNSELRNKSALWDEFVSLVASRSRSAANGTWKRA